MKPEQFGKITHLKPKSEFSTKDFYGLGGSYIKMDRALYENFETIFSFIEWEEDPDGVFNRIPKGVRPSETDVPEGLDQFQKTTFFNENTLKNTSPMIKKLVVDLLVSDHFKTFSSSFDFAIEFTDVWDGSEGCIWHWDGVDDADFLILAYFTDHADWKPEYGGQLEIGRRTAECNIYSDMNESELESLGFIPPEQQTLVVVNNKNPYHVHRCNKLSSPDIRRITMTVGVTLRRKEKMNEPPKVFFPSY